MKKAIFILLPMIAILAACSSSNKVTDSTDKMDNNTLPVMTGDVTPCIDGMAGEFECGDVDLISHLTPEQLGSTRKIEMGGTGVRINDMWGWFDEETQREWALVGRVDAMTFVEVTDPYNPVYVGQLPLTEGANPNFWRDVKVYKNHAYIVADNAGEHGMQVFDLTQLRNVTDFPTTFKETAHYDKINSAHNVVINEASGYAYIVGASGGGETCGGGLHMVDIRQPAKPVFAGCFSDENTGWSGTGYSHDAQCITYQGPDTAYTGHEICFGANENALSIADVTDKKNPKAVSQAPYPNVAYSHQGWISEDHKYFYLNDEGDEASGVVPSTRTLIWDVSDLEDPKLVKEYLLGTKSIDHNVYIKGNYMYQSNYYSGLRILDITDRENPKPAGFFDPMPGDDELGFDGAWSNYPYFRNGMIGVTGINQGFFMVKLKDTEL